MGQLLATGGAVCAGASPAANRFGRYAGRSPAAAAALRLPGSAPFENPNNEAPCLAAFGVVQGMGLTLISIRGSSAV